MSTFLINASNLKQGGGIQVADSICCYLCAYKQHQFIVVLSTFLNTTKKRIEEYENVVAVTYDIPSNFKTVVLGRDEYLDQLVKKHNVNAVLTVFGPSRWKPKVAHLSGFALPQMVIPDSPYFTRMSIVERAKWFFWKAIRKWSLNRSADNFWTENPYISAKLAALLGGETAERGGQF